MTPNFNFTPRFNPETWTLLLDIPRSDIDVYINSLALKAKKHGFTAKNDFHVTIIGKAEALRIRGAISQKGTLYETFKEIGALVEKTEWSRNSCFQYGKYHIRKKYPTDDGGEETRESYIQCLYIPEAKIFLQEFGLITGVHVPALFPHVTMYTKGDGPTAHKGIGIGNAKEFNALAVVAV